MRFYISTAIILPSLSTSTAKFLSAVEKGSFTATLSASVHESAETQLTRIFIFSFLPSMLNILPRRPSTHIKTFQKYWPPGL